MGLVWRGLASGQLPFEKLDPCFLGHLAAQASIVSRARGAGGAARLQRTPGRARARCVRPRIVDARRLRACAPPAGCAAETCCWSNSSYVETSSSAGAPGALCVPVGPARGGSPPCQRTRPQPGGRARDATRRERQRLPLAARGRPSPPPGILPTSSGIA